jgi:hypothetical protein
MEKISTVALRQQAGSTELTTNSTQLLDDASVEKLARLLQQMVPRYPHQDLSPSMESMLHDFEALAVRYGLKTVRDALAELRIRPGQNFFPQPSEVAQECEAMALKAKQEAAKSLPPIGCEKCRDGIAIGYIRVERDGNRYVVECECLKARRAAKNATVPKAEPRDFKKEASGERSDGLF